MRLGMSGFILLRSANYEGQVETRPTFVNLLDRLNPVNRTKLTPQYVLCPYSLYVR